MAVSSASNPHEIKFEAVREVIARFETDPGVQAEVDGGECGTVLKGGERRKLYVFVSPHDD